MAGVAADKVERACDYTFRDEILVVEEAVADAADLVKLAERLNRWKRATIADDQTSYAATGRSNDQCIVDGRVHADWNEWEQRIGEIFHACAHAYKTLNTHLQARHDTYVQILRYQPGQRFGLHVDNIAGHKSWGARQLSAVCFLNDNYEGGRLEFPRQQRTIEPKAGSLVLFPSNFCFPHEAHVVTRGVKYTAVSWFI